MFAITGFSNELSFVDETLSLNGDGYCIIMSV